MASSSSSSSSSSKLRKHGEHGKTNKYDDEVLVVPEDKISELPDAILCHILSFFSTRYAVRSSILSSRWRYLWISVPCIDLSHDDWISTSDTTLKDSYPDVVDRVLHLTELNCFRKFKLQWRNTYDSSRVNEWIRNAIMRGSLEELDLDIRQPVELPPSIFTCKKLVILKLHMRRLSLLNMPVSVCCPCMKSISVYCVRLCNDDSLKNLLNGCPVLEELDFNCKCDDLVRTLFVKSSSLKRFTFFIEYCSTNNTELEMVVEAPNLQRLYISGMVTQKIVVVDLSSVVAVTLNLRRSSVGADVYGNRFCQLLGKMSNTKYMEIHWRTMKSLGQARLENLPTFHNLVTLRVYDNIESSWHVLPFILKCSPNLINFLYSSNGNLQFHMPKCVMLHLEKFSLAASKKGCTDQEMRMVSYFLNNAPVLKEISIYSNLDEVSKMLKEISICSNSDEVSKMLKRFSTLPSRSTACRIIFKSWTTNSTINLYL